MNNFLNPLRKLFGKTPEPEAKPPVESTPIETETSKYYKGGETNIKAKIEKSYYEIYDINVLYGKKVSNVISHYQKICQEDPKINIREQINLDVAKLGKPYFFEFQEKLKETQIKLISNQIEMGERARGIFEALKLVFGIS